VAPFSNTFRSNNASLTFSFSRRHKSARIKVPPTSLWKNSSDTSELGLATRSNAYRRCQVKAHNLAECLRTLGSSTFIHFWARPCHLPTTPICQMSLRTQSSMHLSPTITRCCSIRISSTSVRRIVEKVHLWLRYVI
jgi:hypothetical protein